MQGFPDGAVVKIWLPRQETQDMWVDLWVGKIPWSRKWQPAPVFLPGKSQGQRSLVGSQESDTAEWLSTQHRQTNVCASNSCWQCLDVATMFTRRIKVDGCWISRVLLFYSTLPSNMLFVSFVYCLSFIISSWLNANSTRTGKFILFTDAGQKTWTVPGIY